MNQLVSLHCVSLAERLATELTHEIFDSCNEKHIWHL